MARRATNATAQPVRKRRAHTKSRKGCGNCKLRQIKCDEQKPTCKACDGFGVLCNYGQRAAPIEGILQVSVNGPYYMGIIPSPSAKIAVLGAINSTLRRDSVLESQYPTFQLTSQDLDILTRFQVRTSLTIATTGTQDLYQKESIRFASLYPFFMHLALSITLAHDRHLESSSPLPPSETELSHLYNGTVLFNRRLWGPLTSSERDAIWAGVCLLSASTLAQIDVRTPEKAWPLGKASESDLTWIKTYDTKQQILRIVDPNRPDSCLYPLAEEARVSQEAITFQKSTLEELPQELIRLLRLDDGCAESTNPYRTVANVLDNILAMKSSQSTVMCFLFFLGLMPHDFRSLVQKKEPFALILMAFWYAKFSQFRAWHIRRRCMLECKAVCIYLSRFHNDIPNLEKILEFPRRACLEVGA